MKRTLFIIITIAFSTIASSQINPNALGLRFGGSNSFGAEISYQRGLSNENRVEVDLGIRSKSTYSAFALTGIYQWVWPIQDGFSWYVGPGAQIGSWNWKSDYDYRGGGGTWLALMGQIGIEYQFEIPLQIALDLRPGVAFGDAYGDIFDLGLSLRYTF